MFITDAPIADRHLVTGLAADGVYVAVNDIGHNKQMLHELVQEIEAAGGKSLSIIGDVSREGDVQAMVAKTVEELGGLDIVCFLVLLALRFPVDLYIWIDGCQCWDSSGTLGTRW
jgi:hypothetical protein